MTSLGLNGISTYQGEMAGNGAVAPPASQGGAAPYTAYWKVGTNGAWFAGSMTQTFQYVLNTPYYFKVRDAAGAWSDDGYSCSCSTTACNICS